VLAHEGGVKGRPSTREGIGQVGIPFSNHIEPQLDSPEFRFDEPETVMPKNVVRMRAHPVGDGLRR